MGKKLIKRCGIKKNEGGDDQLVFFYIWPDEIERASCSERDKAETVQFLFRRSQGGPFVKESVKS